MLWDPPHPIKSSLEIRPEEVDFCAWNQENHNLQPAAPSSGERDSNPVLMGSEARVILPSSGHACNTITRYKKGHRLPRDYRASGGEGALHQGMGVLINGPHAPCGSCVTCEFQPLEMSVIWESKHWVDQLAVQHLFPDGQCGVSMDFTQFPGGTGNETIWSQHGNSSQKWRLLLHSNKKKSSYLRVAHEPSPGTTSPPTQCCHRKGCLL